MVKSKRRLLQTKVHFKFFNLSEFKRLTTFKSSSSKKFFLQPVCYRCNLFRCFLFNVITGRRYFFQKFVVTERFFQPPYCCFLWNKCLERSLYFMFLHSNSAVLIHIEHLWKDVLYNTVKLFINSSLFIKVSFYIKWEQNYISKLHQITYQNYVKNVLMPWSKESPERWKTSFLKETVENADLYKDVLNKTMTTQE